MSRVLSICIVGGLIGVALWAGFGGTTSSPARVKTKADLGREAFASKKFEEAESNFRAFVAENTSSPDKQVQNHVTSAKMHLGYIQANRGDFKGARQTFEEASKSHNGTEAKHPDFGALTDQAAYQAIVCLSAEGYKKAARRELIRFIKERPLSPLVYGAFKRITLLDGKPTRETTALFDRVTRQQTEHAKFEMSVCGPKAIAWLVGEGHIRSQSNDLDYQAIARLCGTTADGTSMTGMQTGLKKLGVPCFGYEVNRIDFALLKPPFIWLNNQHYVVVTNVTGDIATAYDPLVSGSRDFKLPNTSDQNFAAPVLAFRELPSLSNSVTKSKESSQ